MAGGPMVTACPRTARIEALLVPCSQSMVQRCCSRIEGVVLGASIRCHRLDYTWQKCWCMA